MRLSCWIVIAVICAPAPAHLADAPLKKVTIAYSTIGPLDLQFSLEKELGFFREEGLRPEFVFVRGGGIAIKGLLAENFDYVLPVASVLDAILKGKQPFRVIFTSLLVDFWVMAQPEIRSVGDLRGKSIGISSPGSGTDLTMREIMRRHGLDAFRDATFLMIGSSQERFAALTSGAVHATLLSHPYSLKAREMGYQKLAQASEYVAWPLSGLGTREDKLRRDSQEVMKVVRASFKGRKFVLTQKEYALSKMMEMFRLSREEAIQTYKSLRDGSVPSGYLTEDAERTAISIIKRAANVTEEIPPNRVFDNRFVKQAERELKGWRPQIGSRQ